MSILTTLGLLGHQVDSLWDKGLEHKFSQSSFCQPLLYGTPPYARLSIPTMRENTL